MASFEGIPCEIHKYGIMTVKGDVYRLRRDSPLGSPCAQQYFKR